MLKFLNNLFFSKSSKIRPIEKILITFFILFLFRFGNTIPLTGIDQDALRKSFSQFENNNSLIQLINMYSGGGGIALLSPFSLGIIPYINASILIDFLIALFPFFEKLQSEEGEIGRKKITFYKKGVTLILAIFQSAFLLFSLKPYFYDTSLISLFFSGLELVTGAFLIVWGSTIIDKKGIGNGTSLIIFTNIIVTFFRKNSFFFNFLDSTKISEIFLLLGFILLICVSQTAKINLDVVSARQLAYLESNEKEIVKKEGEKFLKRNQNGLVIRFNQAGIFPIIIASNLFPFFSFFSNFLGNNFQQVSVLIYYLLILLFNYFYTLIFWDPEKISEQLRKASVSLVNITPGKETVVYLEKIVRSTSLVGGLFLCFILFLFETFKQFTHKGIFEEINISSLIILVGVAYEIQKNLKNLYRNTSNQTIS